jgi:phosphoglucomutase
VKPNSSPAISASRPEASPATFALSSASLESLQSSLLAAHKNGHIQTSTHENVVAWLSQNGLEWVTRSLVELIEGEKWAELNDRFYRTLAFGTGGIRGRTIGRYVTSAERGVSKEGECPENPAAGSNCLNDFNVCRATMGLVSYLKTVVPSGTKPVVVFAHDTRYFSRRFAELAARTVSQAGGRAVVFESERSTPELSFAVRALKAHGGVVITASHNPPHDNGFKAYFADGAQVVEPHASKIIEHVEALSFREISRAVLARGGDFESAGHALDQAYLERLKTLVLEPDLVRSKGGSIRIVFSPIHGTGAKIVPEALRQLGFQVSCVEAQMIPDGGFPTVKSPNPENAEALALGVVLARNEKADVVMATDPDADRMGVAVRNASGEYELLTGNQIGSLLAYYRLERLFSQGVLSEKNCTRARVIKTVVTTDLQKAIGDHFGVPVPETLTGFKYIGAKLLKYEEQLLELTGASPAEYRMWDEAKKRASLLEHSCYYVFGGEESYGYSASDFTRDKDANAACIMFAELTLFAASKGLSVIQYLDQIYAKFGYYLEKLGQLVYEGAEGSRKIKNILASYKKTPPVAIAGIPVHSIIDYSTEDIRDVEGDLLPKELLFFVQLANGSRYAVRGSGTEPKIKFYLFTRQSPSEGSAGFTMEALSGAKREATTFLDQLWKGIEEDARRRAESHA